jgi:hypothetical protein
MSAAVKLQRAFDRERSKSDASRQRADAAKAEFEREWKAKQEKEKQGVAEGSLNEFAPDGFNGDDDEGFSPEIAKMAQEDGFTKGASLADGATLERAMTINHWHSQHDGMYKQHFVKGFKAGRMNKIRHDNKQYNLNLKLMKDGSIRHGEQGVAEGSSESVSLRDMVNVVDQHYPKYYAELSGSDISDKQFERAIVNAYKKIMQKQGVAEDWSKKYKSSINCSHPKGFSQKAHCAGKKKHNESIETEMTCPDCGMCQTHGSLNEIKKGTKDSNGFTKCWSGYHAAGTKKGKNGKPVRNCVPNESIAETIARLEAELESLAEEGKASRKLCASSKPDSELGASQLASCKSQGLRSRDGNKSHKLGKSPKSRVKVGGHKIKGQKYGGPLPDWS